MLTVRYLTLATFAAQLVGSGIGLWTARWATDFDNIWYGGAFATFPGFCLGLVLQYRIQPGSVRENRVTVQRFGLITFLLSLAAFLTAVAER